MVAEIIGSFFTVAEIKKDSILQSLAEVVFPDTKQDLVKLDMIREIQIEGNSADIMVATPTSDRKIQIQLESQIRTKVKAQNPEMEKLKIRFIEDASVGKNIEAKLPKVKNILLVASGKGGVGKSTVTVNLAACFQSMGFKVGILDADIYGPSIGKMFGFGEKPPLQVVDNSIIPIIKNGIKLISFGFLLDDHQPVMWRGPMLDNALRQFLFDIEWGELDFLLIDLPPGTGDTQIGISQLITVTGAIIISTPQSVSTMDASRAATMMTHLKIPLVGIIENMSEFICPHCQTVSHIFSQGGGEKFAKQFNTEFLGCLPLNPEFMQAGEEGRLLPLSTRPENAPAHVKSYFEIAKKILARKDLIK